MELILIGVGVVFFLGWMVPSPLSLAARMRMHGENKALREGLYAKMKDDADGRHALKKEIKKLIRLNENLRMTLASLKGKPGRAELRQLFVYERAVSLLTARTPGFAPYWHNVITEAEKEVELQDRGLSSFVRRRYRLPPAQQPAVEVEIGESTTARLLNLLPRKRPK